MRFEQDGQSPSSLLHFKTTAEERGGCLRKRTEDRASVALRWKLPLIDHSGAEPVIIVAFTGNFHLRSRNGQMATIETADREEARLSLEAPCSATFVGDYWVHCRLEWKLGSVREFLWG